MYLLARLLGSEARADPGEPAALRVWVSRAWVCDVDRGAGAAPLGSRPGFHSGTRQGPRRAGWWLSRRPVPGTRPCPGGGGGADLERFAATQRLGSLLATVYRVDHVSHGESVVPVVGLELSLEKAAPGPGKPLRAQGAEPVHGATPGSTGDEPGFTCSVVPAPTCWWPWPSSPRPWAPRFRTPWGLEYSGSASGTLPFPCRSTPVKDGSERSSVPRMGLEQDACSKPRGVSLLGFYGISGTRGQTNGCPGGTQRALGTRTVVGTACPALLAFMFGCRDGWARPPLLLPRHLSPRAVGLETLRGRVTGGARTPSDPADVAAGEPGGRMGGGGFGPRAFLLLRT